MSDATEKIWGTTRCLQQNSSVELHRIFFAGGRCCSEHYHKDKYNMFYIQEGTMTIRVWDADDSGRFKDTILESGDSFTVDPGIWHQFIGVWSGVAYEMYWTDPGVTLDPEDIVRRTQGKIL